MTNKEMEEWLQKEKYVKVITAIAEFICPDNLEELYNHALLTYIAEVNTKVDQKRIPLPTYCHSKLLNNNLNTTNPHPQVKEERS